MFMIIHTVKAGENVLDIARMYGVPPMKIIEDNALSNPDMTVNGQKIAIFRPTRTYVVRGGDTLRRVSHRFGVRENELYCNNPSLMGEGKIYPGQLLSIYYDQPLNGSIAVDGYVFENFSEEKLLRALPYLTYLTVSGYIYDGNAVNGSPCGGRVTELASGKGVSLLMRIFLPGDTVGNADAFCDAVVSEAVSGGYTGVTLSAFRLAQKRPEDYAELVFTLKKRLMSNDMILFTETDANSLPGEKAVLGGNISDGNVLMYSKTQLSDIPDFSLGEEHVYRAAAEHYENGKVLMDLPCFGMNRCGAEMRPVTAGEAREIAYRNGCDILYDPDKKICHFSYHERSGGMWKEREIFFESPENNEAKLSLCGELGFMGVSFDIERIDVASLMMINTMFRKIGGFSYLLSEGM